MANWYKIAHDAAARIGTLTAEIEQLRAENESLEWSLKAYEEERQELERKLTRYRTEVRQLKAMETGRKGRQMRPTVEIIDITHKDLIDRDDLIIDLRIENERLKKENEVKANVNLQLVQEIKRLKAQVDRMLRHKALMMLSTPYTDAMRGE